MREIHISKIIDTVKELCIEAKEHYAMQKKMKLGH